MGCNRESHSLHYDGTNNNTNQGTIPENVPGSVSYGVFFNNGTNQRITSLWYKDSSASACLVWQGAVNITVADGTNNVTISSLIASAPLARVYNIEVPLGATVGKVIIDKNINPDFVINFTNNGSIQGSSGTYGVNGGDALVIERNALVINNGSIYGGGGHGGKGGDGVYGVYGANRTVTYSTLDQQWDTYGRRELLPYNATWSWSYGPWRYYGTVSNYTSNARLVNPGCKDLVDPDLTWQIDDHTTKRTCKGFWYSMYVIKKVKGGGVFDVGFNVEGGKSYKTVSVVIYGGAGGIRGSGGDGGDGAGFSNIAHQLGQTGTLGKAGLINRHITPEGVVYYGYRGTSGTNAGNGGAGGTWGDDGDDGTWGQGGTGGTGLNYGKSSGGYAIKGWGTYSKAGSQLGTTLGRIK